MVCVYKSVSDIKGPLFYYEVLQNIGFVLQQRRERVLVKKYKMFFFNLILHTLHTLIYDVCAIKAIAFAMKRNEHFEVIS